MNPVLVVTKLYLCVSMFYVVLRVMDGLILKPLNKKDLFARELAFYEEMNSPIASYIPTPKAFVPNYYGVMLVSKRADVDDDFVIFAVCKVFSCAYIILVWCRQTRIIMARFRSWYWKI